MMANKGALIGILVIGGAGIAYAMSKQKETTPLPQSGGVVYTNPRDNDDDPADEEDYTGQGDDSDYIVPTASYLRECEALWDSDGNRKQNHWRLIKTGQKIDNRTTVQSQVVDIEGYRFRMYTNKETYFPGETVRILVKKQLYNTAGDNDWHSWTNAGSYKSEDVRQLLKVVNTTNDTVLKDTGWGSSDVTRTGWVNKDNVPDWLTGGDAEEIMHDVVNPTGDVDKWGINYFDVRLPSTDAEAVGSYSIEWGMDSEYRYSERWTKDNAFKVAPTECATPPPADAAAEGVDQMRLEYTPDVHILPITSINSWQTHFQGAR